MHIQMPAESTAVALTITSYPSIPAWLPCPVLRRLVPSCCPLPRLASRLTRLPRLPAYSRILPAAELPAWSVRNITSRRRRREIKAKKGKRGSNFPACQDDQGGQEGIANYNRPLPIHSNVVEGFRGRAPDFLYGNKTMAQMGCSKLGAERKALVRSG